MTQFGQLELIYNQVINLIGEINSLIEMGDYESANQKIEDKDNLIKKLLLVSKTVNFTVEERQKIDLLNQQIKDDAQNNIISLEKLRDELGEELEKTKKKVKINSAYAGTSQEKQGELIDISE